MAAQAQRISGLERGQAFSITVNGQTVAAFPGESIATVLAVAGFRAFRATDASDSPRGIFCGMGICFDCLVTVNGLPNQRACMTEARAGCDVRVSETLNVER
ncbi:MAG: (2Fe-2S)-binding protein [Chloroflexota bacterium]|nr:MAG: (2Fe-2S)-binding protein [Chloroflexota bacterium]